MKPRHKKLAFIAAGVAGIAVITALIMNAFRSNLVFFFTPTQVIAKEAPVDRTFRIGGLVEKGSLKRENDGLTVHFVVTDLRHDMNVTYKGILPDLFKEGKGVVAEGKLNSDGKFIANQVLAKHDENYMPPEVAAELKAAKASKTKL
ncbi:MAG TPA: cytochrome c maturation protein CcmE [Burkholderiales bacterium]|nr:cytochrome c maturation protein CcmE [Burkholderiales bacterium]